MANYKRVISYMYQYRNQLKGNNVGFARIETRDTQCKITVNIRVPNMKEQDIKSYIYCWYNKEMHGVFLGNVHINNGVGELVVKTDVDNILNSKYRFTDMSGIILYVTEAQYLGTEWDGKNAICNGLFIDQKKPDDFTEIIQNNEKESGLVAAASVDNSEIESTAVKQEEQTMPSSLESHERDNSAGMDALIEDEVAKEKLESSTMTATMIKPEKQEEPAVVLEEEKKIQASVEGQQTEEKPEDQMSIQEQQVQKEEENKPETNGTFPLSQEKIEHLDQQAQELFGTMLFHSLFPDEEEKQAVEEKAMDEAKKEPEEKIEVKGMPTVNPKTAIECFTAFRSCESELEYNEIQEEINTMHAEIAHLERLSDEWRIKCARIKEEQEARVESESKQQQIEQELRASYHIDGLEEEVGAAQLGGTVIDRIFNKYPKIQPFRDGEVEECIRIEPQDLGIFPMENWILANNSFLLHGYYSYRHLIFAMEEEQGRKKFVLGVPGVNHSRERFMANMFGFNEFKNLAQQEEEDGDFGYWCQEIHMHV